VVDKSQWPFTDEDLKLEDIGHGVFLSRVVDTSGNWIGLLEWHECNSMNVTDSGVAAGGVNFENAPESVKGPRWQLVQADPITIMPSVLCRTCGLHGWIREGRWVPA
jgi:hypothetical protein